MKALTIIAALALLAFGVFGLSRTAHAQAANCGPHADVVAGLARNYRETVVAMGISSGGNMIEVFASDTGSWTIIFTTPDGVSCLGASGGAFERVTQGLPKAGVPG